MAQELKAVTVNLKSLDQDIQDPIVAGGADANGRTFRIVFDQEAEAQLTPATKVYLSWFHCQQKTKGYNVFTKVNDDPIIWEIRWPQSMLHEGDVLCCFELVDSVSITQSNNFVVHVLSDPNDGSTFVVSDDFTLFKNAVIRLNCIGDQMRNQMTQQKIEFEDMLLKFNDLKEKTDDAVSKASEAVEKSDKAVANAETAVKRAEDAAKNIELVVDTSKETLEKAKEALAAVDNKVDKNELGFILGEQYKTVKDFVEANISEPHLFVQEFIPDSL